MIDFDLVLKAKENELVKLERERDRLDRLANEGSVTDDLVTAMTKNNIRLKIAERERDQARNDLEAEQQRISSKEYKAEEKRLSEIKKEVHASVPEIVKDAREMIARLDQVDRLVSEYQSLARTHSVARIGRGLGLGMIWRLWGALKRWSGNYRSYVEKDWSL